MKDVREGLAMGDMAMRDDAVSGGAFGGARSRLRRSELGADTARGAAEQIELSVVKGIKTHKTDHNKHSNPNNKDN